MNRTKNTSLKIAFWGILTALALALSFIENMIDVVPIPAARLGLANIIVMYAFTNLGFVPAYSIVVMKSLFAFVTRGFMAFVMSICGGTVSLLFMIIIWILFKNKLTFVGVAVVGAVAHTTTQLFVSSLLMHTPLWIMGVWLFPIAIATGVLTGFVINLAVTKIPPKFNLNLNKEKIVL